MRKIILLLSLLLVLPLFFSSVVYAQETLNAEVQVNHVANVFEKFQEKVVGFLKFSNGDKYKYKKFILEKRLAELEYVIEGKKDWTPIEETSSRYSTYLGKFNDFFIESNLSDKKTEVLDMYVRHAKLLEELQKNFEFESGWWLLLQHDINYTKIYSDKVH